MQKTCIDCGVGLTDKNWSESSQRGRRYLCRECATARASAHAQANRDWRRQYMAQYYQGHKDKFAANSRAYQKAHPEKAREWARKSVQKNRSKRYAKQREWVRTHRPRLAINAKRRRAKLRDEILQEYGRACQCCGESRVEFLCLDHANGDGAAHRKQIGKTQRGGGSLTYTWLKKQGFPKDGRFRILCHNCNCARAFYGTCPHERERGEAKPA
jgi:hypothetical protein